MNWNEIWIKLFGATEWMGINLGFWTALGIVVLIVAAMNVTFWSMKPLHPKHETR